MSDMSDLARPMNKVRVTHMEILACVAALKDRWGGRKKGRGIGERGEGTSSLFPSFALFSLSPLPPLPLPPPPPLFSPAMQAREFRLWGFFVSVVELFMCQVWYINYYKLFRLVKYSRSLYIMKMKWVRLIKLNVWIDRRNVLSFG